MTDCIFCKIVKGEIPAIKIWENENYLAFLDLNPINNGHALLIPKKHADYIFDLSDREYSELMLNAKKIAKLLKKKLNPKRVGVIIEGFAVPHVHIHLVPINDADEICNQRKPIRTEELNKIAKKIKK